MLEKYEFYGQKDGINLLILAAVHGNETAGTKAIRRILPELESGKIKLQQGKVTFIPVCNKEAYDRDIRQVDENLNRVMKIHQNPQTNEQRIANELCPLIEANDIMLDLHSTHCEGDVPFVFCDYPDKYNKKLIAGLPVNFVLEGWPDIYAGQKDIEDYSTEHCAHIYGKTGTTLECGYHKSADAVEIAGQAIINTMAVFGMIDSIPLIEYPKTHILMQSYIVKKREGKLCRAYKHLDEVKKGEMVAHYDDGEILYAPDDGYILLPNLKAEIGAEWYYFGKKL